MIKNDSRIAEDEVRRIGNILDWFDMILKDWDINTRLEVNKVGNS